MDSRLRRQWRSRPATPRDYERLGLPGWEWEYGDDFGLVITCLDCAYGFRCLTHCGVWIPGRGPIATFDIVSQSPGKLGMPVYVTDDDRVTFDPDGAQFLGFAVSTVRQDGTVDVQIGGA